jgi:hypothetical protein
MDSGIRDIEREADSSGWTPSIAKRWVRAQDRINPESPPRKSLKLKSIREGSVVFKNGKPVQGWGWRADPKDYEDRDNFEFNDILTFKTIEKANRSRTTIIFTSSKYDGIDIFMNIRNFRKAVPLMARGILKGRFVWRDYDVVLVEEL